MQVSSEDRLCIHRSVFLWLSESCNLLEPETSFRLQCCIPPSARSTTVSTLNNVVPHFWLTSSAGFTDNHDGYTTTRRVWRLNYTHGTGPLDHPRAAGGTMSDSPQTATENSFMSNDALIHCIENNTADPASRSSSSLWPLCHGYPTRP